MESIRPRRFLQGATAIAGAPSRLAVSLAQEHGLTLVGFVREDPARILSTISRGLYQVWPRRQSPAIHKSGQLTGSLALTPHRF
jgi:hypothetical protein